MASRAERMRTFGTGATRGADEDKLDYEGFISPLAWERYAQYLHKHRIQVDGQMRASDNWQKGIPKDAYIKSAFRHFMSWWLLHRGHTASEELEEALCALLFNVQGYLHEHLRAPKTFGAASLYIPGASTLNASGQGWRKENDAG